MQSSTKVHRTVGGTLVSNETQFLISDFNGSDLVLRTPPRVFILDYYVH